MNAFRPVPWFPWNGSKRWLLGSIAEVVALWSGSRYIEPFVGGGCVSQLVRHLKPKASQLVGDKNPWLLAAYEVQASTVDAEDVVPSARQLTRAWIDRQRALVDDDLAQLTPEERALRFAACLFTAWGNRWEIRPTGEFRSTVNKRYCEPAFLRAKLVQFFSVRWLRTRDRARAVDWSRTVAAAKPGDLVYLDSPYPEALGYGIIWRFNDHLDVLDWAVDAAERGVAVVISNMSDLERLYARAGLSTRIIQGPRRSRTRAVREEVLAWSVA